MGLLAYQYPLAKYARAGLQKAPPDLFHRATPLSWLTPGPEALRPSIAAGLPWFG
jgi:hypothetical protein